MKIEEKYKKLDDIDHVLMRPGMYIGSVTMDTATKWLMNEETGKFEETDVTFNPGFLKLFDEIITNSVDEHKRNPNKLNVIKVNIDTKKNEISVWDNGGIPVEMHKQEKVYVPELIFSNLKAGQNFNDDEAREVAGTNGVGSSCVNIFSTKFVISTCDGKKKFLQTYTDNMRKRKEPIISESKTNHTEISFIPDLPRFDMTSINDTHIRLLYKRTIDLAGANPNAKFYFNNVQIKIKTFKDYINMYPIETCDELIYDEAKNWSIGITNSQNGNQQVSFVNSIETYDGGSHVDYILSQITERVRAHIKKKTKNKVDPKPSEIKGHIFLFMNTTIINPKFSSQTKEKLINNPKDFGSTYTLSEKNITKILKGEIVNSILDWYTAKNAAEESKEMRMLTKNVDTKSIEKLIDANGKDRSKCELRILEGQSAAAGIRQYRDPTTQGAFMLKGKFMNVTKKSDKDVISNPEAIGIMNSIGLKIGEKAELSKLRYSKIIILTDQDKDGDSICGLLINFFYTYWKELFDMGVIYRNETPLVVAKSKKDKLLFYNMTEYKAWEAKNDATKWDISYKKGLAALENEEYEEILANPKMVKINPDERSKEILKIWFDEDAEPRKIELTK